MIANSKAMLLHFALVFSVLINTGCIHRPAVRPEPAESYVLIGFLTEGALPTPEQMSEIESSFGYINNTKKIVYADKDSRPVVAELMGVQVEGERWIRTENGKATEFTILGLSELDFQSEGDDVEVIGRLYDAECKLIKKNTCHQWKRGSVMLLADRKVCVKATNSHCDYYGIEKVDAKIWPLEWGCPKDVEPIEMGMPLYVCN